MMSHHQNAHGVSDDPEQKVIGKAAQIRSSQIAFADGKRPRLLSRFFHEAPQLGVEVVREFPASDALVVPHDRIHTA